MPVSFFKLLLLRWINGFSQWKIDKHVKLQLWTQIFVHICKGYCPSSHVIFYLWYKYQWITKPCHFNFKGSDFFMYICLNLPCSENHSNKIVNFMLDIMCPIIHEGESVPQELLDTVLVNIIEPQKVTPRIISFLWFMFFDNSIKVSKSRSDSA